MENENTEVKENWFKKNGKVCIIALVAILAIVAVVVVLLMNQKDSPEKVMESYINAMASGDVDAMMKITDLKGYYAWEQCDKDASKFAEEYKKATNEDTSSYEEDIKSTLESGMQMLQAFGGLEMTINSIETPEKLADDLYKVKANIKMKITVLGMDQEQDQDMAIVTYNGKYVGEYSE